MERRTKLILYASLYAVILGALGYWVYVAFFQVVPNCEDEILNQDEDEIDCGGVCMPCEVKNFEIIQGGIDIVDGGGGRSTIVTSIATLSENYGAKGVEYEIRVYDPAGNLIKLIERDTEMPPDTVRYIVEAGLAFTPEEIGDITLSFEEGYEILPKEKFTEHNVLIRQPKLQYARHAAVISGIVTNNTGHHIDNLRIVGLLFDRDNKLVGGSATLVDDLRGFKSQDFNVFIPPLNYALESLSMGIYWEVLP